MQIAQNYMYIQHEAEELFYESKGRSRIQFDFIFGKTLHSKL